LKGEWYLFGMYCTKVQPDLAEPIACAHFHTSHFSILLSMQLKANAQPSYMEFAPALIFLVLFVPKDPRTPTPTLSTQVIKQFPLSQNSDTTGRRQGILQSSDSTAPDVEQTASENSYLYLILSLRDSPSLITLLTLPSDLVEEVYDSFVFLDS
jgi:hypothetical protein